MVKPIVKSISEKDIASMDPSCLIGLVRAIETLESCHTYVKSENICLRFCLAFHPGPDASMHNSNHDFDYTCQTVSQAAYDRDSSTRSE